MPRKKPKIFGSIVIYEYDFARSRDCHCLISALPLKEAKAKALGYGTNCKVLLALSLDNSIGWLDADNIRNLMGIFPPDGDNHASFWDGFEEMLAAVYRASKNKTK